MIVKYKKKNIKNTNSLKYYAFYRRTRRTLFSRDRRRSSTVLGKHFPPGTRAVINARAIDVRRSNLSARTRFTPTYGQFQALQTSDGRVFRLLRMVSARRRVPDRIQPSARGARQEVAFRPRAPVRFFPAPRLGGHGIHVLEGVELFAPDRLTERAR